MIMVKNLLPLFTLPFGEGVMLFVRADSFMGGAIQAYTVVLSIPTAIQ